MTDHYMGVLLEEMDKKIDLILKGQSVMATSADLRVVDERLTKVEKKVALLLKVVKEEAAITRKHTSTLTDHEIRITDLEDHDPKYA